METRTLLRERLRRSRDWSAAIDELEKELEQSGSKPEQSERLFELARVTEDVVPERERALALYQRAWKLHPDNLKALSRAREVYGELGRFEMVAKLGEMELKSPAASAELAGIVGEAMLDSGQKDKAQAVLERAIERTPDSWRVKEAIAALNYDPEFWTDEVERLTAAAKKAEKAEPELSTRMLLRAARILRLEQPDDPRLEELVMEILARDIDEPSANFLYESLLAAQQRWDELEQLHEQRIQSRPDTAARADACRGFALEWIQRFKDKERGAAFFARALRTVASNGAAPLRSIVAAFAMVRQVHGDKNEWAMILDLADSVLDRIAGEDKLYVSVQAGLIAWKKVGDEARARKYFRVAAEIAPENPDVEDFRSQVGFAGAGEPAASAAPAPIVDTVTAPAWPPPPVTPKRATAGVDDAVAVSPAAPAPKPMPAAMAPAASGPIPIQAADKATAPSASPPPPAPPPAAPVPAPVAPVAPVAHVASQPPPAPARVEEIPPDLDAAMAAAKNAESGADKGVAAWKDVVAKHASKLGPRRELARVLRTAGAWAQLVDALKDEESKAAQTPAEKAQAFRELAEAYAKLNNENQVIASLTSALAQDGSQLALYDQLAGIYEGKKRWPDLVKVLGEKAERVDGAGKIAIYLQIANLYLERFSNQAEAIKAFERVLELDPNNVHAVDHLLQVYEKRRDWEKLIKLKEAEIERAPAAERGAKTIAVAQMAAQKVKKPEICTFWWEKVLDYEPHHDEALAELYKLYERNKDWTKLADVCSRQAEVAADDKAKIDALQRLGLLYTEKVEDSAKAIDAWQRLLTVDKENRRAQDALKKLYVTEARWDELEEFYRSRGKTEEYVRVLEREVEAGPEQHRLELAMKIAVLYRDELQKADRAMRAFEKVLSLDAENLAAAEALIPLYETSRDPRKLVGVLEIQLKATPRDDRALRRERLEKLAEYNEGKLKDKGAAFKWWLEAHREDHEAESIHSELERLAQETGAWQELVDAYSVSLPKFKAKADALPLMLVIARVDEQELGEIDRALDMNRAILEIDPANEQALDALERLYLGKGRYQDLLGVYAKKLDLTADGELRIQIQSKIGQLYEDEIKDDTKAVAAYQAILDAAGDEPIALAALDRIYLRNGNWKELADVLGRELTIVDPGSPTEKAAHLELKYRLGQVREQHLGDVPGAIDAYRDILDLDPAHGRGRTALEGRLGDDKHKLASAGILEPIYEQLGEWSLLASVHEIQLAAEKDRLRRVGLLMRIGELHRTRLGAADKAFDAYARSFREDPSAEGAKAQLEDLAGLIDDGWPRLVKLFEDALAKGEKDKDLDPTLAHELATKVAEAYEARLDDSDKAVAFYKKALAIEPDDLGALGALEAIFHRDEKYPELLEVYRRKADIASEPAERLDILFRIASIHEEMLNAPDEAISAYQEVLGQDADNLAALRALDRLYVGSQQWRDLGDNLTRQLTLVEDDGERVGLLYRLAQLRETHLREVAAAVETYRQVLDLDPTNQQAVGALERLVALPDQELAIANILEPIYKGAGDWKKQIGVYEIMVRHAFDPVRKIELLHQISELHEVGGDASDEAFATYSRALREDPRNENTQAQLDRLARMLDRWKDLVALYDQVAKEAQDDDLKVQLLFKLAQIHAGELADDKAAVATYQRILAVAPGSVDAASEIQDIHERNGDWPALVAALEKKAEILLDVPAKKQLLYRAAQIEEEVLSDADAAIATFRAVLEVDEIDPVAMDALERLYIRLERWEPLKDIYAKKADLAEDPADKKQMLYVLGQVYDRELGDVAKSIETYQAILDLDADELPAIQALDRLYGQAERWYDLLGILERQVELADSTGEMVALKYRIGHLWQTHLGDVARAIESYREALEMDPSHAETLAALDVLLHGKTEPVMAARVLEPIYEAGGEHAKLVDVLEVMVAANDDALSRVELLHRLTALHEQRLDAPKAAFGALGRALKDDAGNALTLGHLERLADLTASWRDLAGLYQGEADKTIDVPRQVDLLTRLARVHEEELSDVDKSIGTYRKILEAEFDNKPAVLALDRLYTQTSRWRELSEILRREIQLADNDEEIVQLQFRLGQTLESSLGDSKAAVEVYREILTSHPSHAPTLAALEELFHEGLEGKHQAEIGSILEPLYETAGEFEKLHRIYEVQLSKLTTGPDRQSMYQRLAELAETRLYDGGRAFTWWGEALVEDPTWDQALDEAERLARETGSWDELVAVYTRALERHAQPGAGEKEMQKRTLLRLARVYEVELSDAHRAVETHLRVLELDARDPEALAALDRLYLGAAMYDELVEILRRRIEISQDPDEAIELQFRRGAIFSDALGDLDASLRCYQAVLDQESRNRRALEAQEGIYFRREDWQKLHDTYEKLIDCAEGDDEMADIYARMARIASDALGQDDKAMDLLGRVLDIRGEDPAALAALSDLYTRKEKWDELVEIIERQVAVAPSDGEQIALYKRLGRVWSEKLGRERSALDAWLCADRLDRADLETLRALAALYQSTQSWDELSQTLNRIIDVGIDTGQINEDQTIELYAQLGQLEGEILGRVDDAVEAWRKVLALDPSDFRALGALEQLFTREARWEEAIEVMEKRALVLDDERARIDTMLQAASTWEEKVENLGAAAEVYERVRATDIGNVTASERLEAIYRIQYKWPELSEVLLERVDQREDVQEQITLLNQVAKIYETEIGDQDAAFVVLQAAFKRDYSHEDTAKELERLATATNRWAELLEEYSHQVAELETSDRSAATDLWVKIGRWYGEHLSHIEYAIHSVQQALRIDPNHLGALTAVAELQRKRGSWGELIETLSKHASVEQNPDKRTDLYLNLADLYENQIQDANAAIAAYQQAVAANPESKPALVALERLYRRTEQWDALIDVLARRAALETDDRDVVRLRLEIGQIWDLRLYDAGQAIGAYSSVLEVDSANLPALRALEQLYDKTNQPEKYLEVLEAQLDASPTDAERVSLYERMAAAWEERFGKLDRAAEALEKIVALDPRNFGAFRELARLYFQAGKWESLVDTYRNHIMATTDVATRIDLYCAMGQIYEQQLQDNDRSIEAYADVLTFDTDEPRALDALGRLYEKIGEWDRAIDAMTSLVRLTEDPRKQVELFSRIGRLHHSELRDGDGAENNLLRALAIDPGHVATMETLVKLYSDRGDWLKAAQMMVRAEQYTPVALDKVRLLYDAAQIFQNKLRQPEQAKSLYASVIAIDPEHVEAGRPLAEIYFQNEEWAPLSPVIGMLVRKVAQSRPDPRDLNELYYRAARTADELGDHDTALHYYEAAYNIDSTHLPVLLGRADLLFKMQDWDGAGKIYQTILVQHRESQDEADVVRIYFRLGMVRQNLGERKKALNMFEKALEIDPTHRDTLSAVIALQQQQGDWEAVVHAKRSLMATAADKEKVALLDEIGGIYHQQLTNPQKAIGAYLEALEVSPEDHTILQKVQDLYAETKQWKKVVENIQRFIELEQDTVRKGAYYYAAGTISRDELKALDEAMEFYNHALDSFFDKPERLPQAMLARALKAFEAIDKITTTKRDWNTQQRAYRAMIKRLDKPGANNEQLSKLRVSLLDALGEIYRSRLKQYQSSIAAFELAAQLDPENQDRAEKMAELYLVAGPDYADKAIEQHMKMLRVEPFKYDSYKALRRIYMDTHQYDKTWCLCNTLAFLKKADPDELQFYEQYKPRGLVKAKAMMTNDSWGKLIHPDENRYVSSIFAAVWQGVAAMKAYPHKDANIKRKDKRMLAGDPLMFSKLFYYVGQVLNVPLPEVFIVEDNKQADIQLGNFIDKTELCPAFIVRPHLMQGKNEREVAFISARRLTFMRPEYYLKMLLPTNTELRVALSSAIAMVNPKFPVPAQDVPNVQAYVPEVHKRMQPQMLEHLVVVVNRFIQNAPTDPAFLGKWGHAVDATSYRAGFTVCGDLEVAARMVSAEPVAMGGPQVKDKIKELVLFSISEHYFAVRAQMGLTIG